VSLRTGTVCGPEVGTQCFDLGEKVPPECIDTFLYGPTGMRFGDVATRAEREGIKGGHGASLRQSGAHDDRQMASAFFEMPQCLQAVHDRHFDIQSDHIGLKFRNFGESDLAIHGVADHFNFWIFGQQICDGPPDYQRIIYNQHSSFFDHKGVSRS